MHAFQVCFIFVIKLCVLIATNYKRVAVSCVICREVCLTRKQSEVTDGVTFQQTRISSLVLGKKINPL